MQYCRRQKGKNFSRELICLICAGVAALAALDFERARSEAAPDGRAFPIVPALARRGVLQDSPGRALNPAELAFEEARRLETEHTEGAKQRALAKYEEALKAWAEAGDARSVAKTLIRVGQASLDLGDADRALKSYKDALAASRRAGDRAQEVEIYNLLGVYFYSNGNHKQAQAEARKALNLSRVLGDRPQEAKALHTIGNAFHALDKVKPAIEFHLAALNIREELGDRFGQFEILVKLGYAYVNLSEMREAEKVYGRALNISREIKKPQAEAAAERALGNLKTKIGQRQEAFTHFDRALEILKPLDEPRIKATVTGGLAYAFECAGDTTKALEKYQEALEAFTALKSKWGIAETETPIGEIHFALKDYSKAFEHYNRALDLFREMKMARWVATTLRNLGLVYDAMGNRAEALRCYRESIALTTAGHDLRSEAYTLNYLGNIYERDGSFLEAQTRYKKALKYSKESSDRAGQSLALFSLAHLARDRRQLENAREYIDEAIGIAEELRADLVNHELRAAYFASAGQYYDLKIDILMRLHDQRPEAGYAVLAFETSERARARSLIDSLGETRAGIRKGIDSALLQQEQNLQARRNEIADRLQRLGPSGRHTEEYQRLNREIVQLSMESQRLSDRIKLNNPRYAALTQPQPLGLSEIQRRLLDGDSLLLEYALGDERSYCWVVKRDEFIPIALPSRSEIEQAAGAFYQLISSDDSAPGETSAERLDRIRASNQHLSRLLLGPIAGRLDRKRILLSAEGILQLIPFQTLEDQQKAVAGNPMPMVAGFEIVNEPSASALIQLLEETKDRAPQTKEIAVLADPVYSLTDSRSRAARGVKGAAAEPPKSMIELPRTLRDLRGAGGEIPRLYASQKEANSILNFTTPGGGMMATGFEASRNLAVSSILNQYRVVHFATHGVLNEEHPDLSGVVLSMVDRQGHAQDGVLRLHDIYNLNLPVDLVVLSACSTAKGKEVKGEGLIGLTRGFMYAGAASVVASLWKVDDGATSALMTMFYKGLLQEKLSASEALRRAQLEMASQEQWRSPYFWAGFVIQGKYAATEVFRDAPKQSAASAYSKKILGIAAAAMGLVTAILLIAWKRRNDRIGEDPLL